MFMQSMQRVYPDRETVDIPDSNSTFHSVSTTWITAFRCRARSIFPPAALMSGRLRRGIYDDRGPLLVAICHNMDLGDAWEYAHTPQHDEKFAGLAFRIVSNYVVYAMTH
jgi:hypothetical protein